MLSQPHSSLLTPNHQSGTLEHRGSSDRNRLHRTSSFSSLLFTRRPSTSSSVASSSSIYSPLHQNIWSRQTPISTELDHCWGGGGRRSREVQRESYQDFYDFLKAADLDEYYSVFSKHLKIRTVSQLKYVTDIELTEMGMSRPEVRRLKKHFERECPQTTMGKLKKKLGRSTSARPPNKQRATTEPPADARSSPHADTSGISGYRIIPASELDLASPLGQGEFGRVHQGLWRPSSMGRQLQVAVKILDLDRFPTKTEDFLKEAAIMNNLDHPDIVRLYGVCVAPKCLRLVTELAPLRSLLECLREPDLRTSFPVSTLHNFAVQIARGMSYLEEERLVHRDLAARNILVFAKDKVKIGDFGLSRALQLGKSYYQTNFNANLRLPIAWCALEAIHDLRFTSASDVWSYGVTLWEMFTYGFVPWAGLSGKQILEAVDVPNSRRLAQPDACPDAVFDAVMRACWNHEPNSRPTFAQLTEMLPHLSPQAWSVVEDSLKTESSPPKIVNDIRPFLTENGSHEADAPDVDNQPSKSLLKVRAGETVYVLSKKNPELWKVVSHSTCQVGYVPPENLRIVSTTVPSSQRTPGPHHHHHTSGGTLSRMRLRFSRRGSEANLPDIGQSNRGSPRGPMRLNRDLISLPQNDFRHVGHVGADGTVFGDVGFSLEDVEGGKRDSSPTDSCLTIESTSDKENPRLSDLTINEQRASRGSPVAYDRVKALPSHPETCTPPPLRSPSENSRIAEKPCSATQPPPSSTPAAPPSWFSTSNDAANGCEASILDMGSSFMEEIFQCLSAKTDGLGISAVASPEVGASQSAAPVTSKTSPPPSPTRVEREASSSPPISVRTPLPPVSKPTRSRETTPSEFSSQAQEQPLRNAIKRLSLDQANGFDASSPSLSSADAAGDRASLVDTSSRHFRGIGGSSSSRAGTTSTLARAFRKSSASLTRRSAAQKAPSALSLEQPQAPLIKGRLEPSGKLKRPIISGPVMISNPVLFAGSSAASILSSEGTTTAAVSTPPLSLHETSRGSSITAFSNSTFPFGAASNTTLMTPPATTTSSTTPSISPAPSTSSLATSSNSSSNIYNQSSSSGYSRFAPPAAILSSSHGGGGGGLRALRDRCDLVFRAPAMSSGSAFVGRRRANPVNAADHESSLKERLNPSAEADVSSAARVEPTRISSYSTRERSADQQTNPSPSELDQSSSVATPTASDYTFIPPSSSLPGPDLKSSPPSQDVTASAAPASSEIGGGLSEELLSFWGSEFASILGESASAAS
uniref:non-specific protein-tyrosine kinase n=1 Tax=Mesocestoides corti TaxID=53468 RepID=A0A5K3EHV7_MESCO